MPKAYGTDKLEVMDKLNDSKCIMSEQKDLRLWINSTTVSA